MATIAIVGIDATLTIAYTQALKRFDFQVDVIPSDVDAIRYLVRQKKAPDVMVLDMQWPGSTEMVALGAMQRLQHLVNTKLLIITSYGNKVPPSWGAEITLYPPVAPHQLAATINNIIDTPESPFEQSSATRVWWDGQEARFLRWTDQALVLAWADASETAVKLPRGAAVRLIKKGILRIEGPAPTWAQMPRVSLKNATPAPAESQSVRAATPPDRKPTATVAALTSANTIPAIPDPPPPPPAPMPPASAPSPSASDKMNIVARLIRKLTGGNPDVPLSKGSRTV